MGRARMRFSSKIIWAVCIVLVIILVVDQVMQLVDADSSDSSIEQAIREALKRKKARALEMANDFHESAIEQASNIMGDSNGVDDLSDDDEAERAARTANQKAALVCFVGAIFSLYTLLMEHKKWDPKSFQRFSVATKIPVEIFCISGPLVLVSAFIYLMLAGLLLTETSSSSAFIIASSWSAIMVDMSFVCYTNALYEIFSNKIDLVLHLVNITTVVYTFNQLRFFPYTFVICGMAFWAVVIGQRVHRRYRFQDGEGGGLRPGSP